MKEYHNSKGELHRTNGPAVINESTREQQWWLNGKLHREGGPAIVYGDYSEWYINGKLHNTNGPAVIQGYYKAWYLNGKRHREGGPAIVDYNENRSYFINGNKVSKEEMQMYAFVDGRSSERVS